MIFEYACRLRCNNSEDRGGEISLGAAEDSDIHDRKIGIEPSKTVVAIPYIGNQNHWQSG